MKRNTRVDLSKCPRLSTRKILSDNWFLIKLIFSAAPLGVSMFALEQFRVNAFIFLEHTWMIQTVLECVEYGRSFRDAIVPIIFIAALLTVTSVLGSLVGQLWIPKAKLKAQTKLKSAVFEKAKEVDLKLFDDPEYYNDFIQTVEKIDQLIDYIFDIIGVFAGMLGTVLTTGVYFAYTSPPVLIIVALTSAVWLIFLLKRSKLRYSQYSVSRKDMRRRDYIKRLFYLKDFAKELRLNPEVKEHSYKDYDASYDSIVEIFSDHNIEIVKSDIMAKGFQFILMDMLAVLAVAYQASVLDLISYATVVVVINSMYKLRRAFVNIIYKVATSTENCMFVEKCRSFLETEPTVTSNAGRNVSEKPSEIELRNVWFRYNENEDYIIKDVSLKIRAGEKIALVGYNGAGKTTLIKLIMRLYDTTKGEILLDGVNIKEYSVEEYRHRIGVVFQDFNLYAATVAENVVMGISDAHDKCKIKEALKRSGFAEKLNSLEAGVDTNLTKEFEDDGVELSGGEAQKIAIARAFYKNSGLIILDEPSAALDPIAEYNFNCYIANAAGDSTVIFISHRLSTTRLSDRIIMLEDGRVCEEGTHTELLSLGGRYAEMWHTQADKYTQ